MIRLIHNESCSKSNCALDYVKMFPSLNIQVRNYLENPLVESEIKTLIQKLNLPIASIVRRSDTAFIAQYGSDVLTDEAYIKALIQNPQFLQRPILEDESIAIIGRPPENILAYLKAKL